MGGEHNGVDLLRSILEYIKELDETDLNRWRTQARVSELLKEMLAEATDEPLFHVFQAHVRARMEDASFFALLCKFPARSSIIASSSTRDVSEYCASLRHDLKVLY